MKVVVMLGSVLFAAALLLITPRSFAADYTIHAFQKIQLTNEFWSEGANFGDFNRDGHNDIVSGPYWYEGPDFKKRHEFRPASRVKFLKFVIDPKDGRSPDKLRYSDSFVTYVYDFNGDGWPDILSINVPGKEASWYKNPGKKGLAAGTPWRRHAAFDVVNNESPTFGDLLGTGQPVLVFMTGGYVGYATPDWNNPAKHWTFHAVSAKGEVTDGPYIHGLGYGDVNGDGRSDILGPDGWWEQPVSVKGNPVWRFHRWSFLQPRPEAANVPLPDKPTEEQAAQMEKYYEWPYTLGAAQIYAYDVNGDGLPDIISSLHAHGFGLAWFEQMKDRDANGEIQFKRHIIINKEPSENPYGVMFSQLHAVELVDVDGDGLKDIVTGKRFWAHGRYSDEEPGAPAVLYWFKLVRKPSGEAEFVPYLIDSDSGIGTQFAAGDVSGHGLTDIVVGNKKGTFVFRQEIKKVTKEEWERSQPKVLLNAPVPSTAH